MLAHGAVLRKNVFTGAELIAIVHDFRHAGLTDEEVALMSYAQKITLDASTSTSQDIDDLRGYGLTDAEILDVTIVATARNFFSKTLDALGAAPDKAYHNLEPELVQVLSTGRVFA
jgi:alkylhydroperoxidase family enzyme